MPRILEKLFVLPIIFLTLIAVKMSLSSQTPYIELRISNLQEPSILTFFMYDFLRAQCRVYFDVEFILPADLKEARISLEIFKKNGAFYGKDELSIDSTNPSPSVRKLTPNLIFHDLRCDEFGAIMITGANCLSSKIGWFNCANFIESGKTEILFVE